MRRRPQCEPPRPCSRELQAKAGAIPESIPGRFALIDVDKITELRKLEGVTAVEEDSLKKVSES